MDRRCGTASANTLRSLFNLYKRALKAILLKTTTPAISDYPFFPSKKVWTIGVHKIMSEKAPLSLTAKFSTSHDILESSIYQSLAKLDDCNSPATFYVTMFPVLHTFTHQQYLLLILSKPCIPPPFSSFSYFWCLNLIYSMSVPMCRSLENVYMHSSFGRGLD